MAEWDEDIAEILEKAGRLDGGRADGEALSLPALRDLLASAWQYGYTTGMRDSASFDDALPEPTFCERCGHPVHNVECLARPLAHGGTYTCGCGGPDDVRTVATKGRTAHRDGPA